MVSGFKETKLYFEDIFKKNWLPTEVHYAGQEFSGEGKASWVNPYYTPTFGENFGMCENIANSYGTLNVACWASTDVDAMVLADEVILFMSQYVDKNIYRVKSHEVNDHGWHDGGMVYVYLSFTIESLVVAPDILDITYVSPNAPQFARSLGGAPTVVQGDLINLVDYEWRITSKKFITSLAFVPDIDAKSVTVNIGGYLEDISDFISGFTSLSTFTWTGPSYRISNIAGICYGCTELIEMPCIDTAKCTDLTDSWNGCDKMTEMVELDTRNVTLFVRTWNMCNGLLTAPNVIVSSGIDFTETFHGLGLVVKYGDLDTAKGQIFDGMFWNNSSLTCMMKLDTRNMVAPAIDMFLDCPNLTMPSVGYQVQLANDGIEWINGSVC